MTTILITGATSGLGFETAKAARAHGVMVLCAGRDESTARAAAQRTGAQPVTLDLARLDDLRTAATRLPRVDVVACNAGLQILRGPTHTPDGFEETFQVNHLAHLALVDALLQRPTPPRRVAFVGSGTHDPAIRTGTPDPLTGTLMSFARSEQDTEPARTAGLRRYTTSKLLAVATAAALARERPDVHVCQGPWSSPHGRA